MSKQQRPTMKITSCLMDSQSGSLRISGSLSGVTGARLRIEDADGAVLHEVPEESRVRFDIDVSLGEARPKRVVVLAEDSARNRIDRAEVATKERYRFATETVSYDIPSRQARYLGWLLPGHPIRDFWIEIPGRGRIEINRSNLERIDVLNKYPQFNNRFSGFSGRIDFVGMADLGKSHFVIDFVDGWTSKIPFPMAKAKRNVPLGLIQSVEADLIESHLKIKGWYRAFDPITGVVPSIGGQTVFGIPKLSASTAIDKEQGFREIGATTFEFAAPLKESFDDPSFIDGTDALRMDVGLFNKKTKVFSLGTGGAKMAVRRAFLDTVLFDRRSSTVYLEGIAGGWRRPNHFRLWRDGEPVSKEPTPLDRPTPDSGSDEATDWSGAVMINGVVQANTKFEVELFDADRKSLGFADTPKRSPILVNSATVVKSPDAAAIVENLFQAPLTKRRSDLPLFVFVFPGTLGTLGGGAARRVKEMMSFFRDNGYRICLIDRTELPEIVPIRSGHEPIHELVDIHIRVPKAYRIDMCKKALEALKGLGTRARHQNQLADMLAKTISGGRLEKGESTGIYPKMDSQFNYLAAYFVDALRPAAVFGVFAWSAEALPVYPPGVVRILDTHDVQHHRHEVFERARREYGDAAVSDLDRLKATAEEEAALLDRADIVVAISPKETEILGNLIGPHKVVHTGVGTREVTPLPGPAGSTEVLFIGNHYEPNIFAIRKFIIEQLPILVARRPDAKLRVVGRVCDALTDLPHPNVEYLGRVEALAEYYASAAVVLNPVLFGTGISIKTIEALGFGKCVVGTDSALEQFSEPIEAGVILHAPFDGLGNLVADLLDDEPRRFAVEAAAAAYASHALDSSMIMGDLVNLIESKLFYNG